MAKQSDKLSPDTIESNMGTFLKQLSTNVGFSLSEKTDKSSFNPYSVDNSNIVCALFVLMNTYSEKQKKKPIIPTGAISLPRNSGVKFEFSNEIDTDLLIETIEDKNFDNIEITSDRSITIMKNQFIRRNLTNDFQRH